MQERRQAEVERLRQRYNRVDHGPNVEWVIVRNVPLRPGWNRATTDVLFIMPAGFPETPPDNFYVSAGLRLASGGTPQNFNPNGLSQDGASWDMFSWHVDVGWSPAARIEDGSSLTDFMREAERRLSEVS